MNLASRFNGEIVNADAMQMYQGLPVVTNKISVEEQRGIPHHLLGGIYLNEPTWHAYAFQEEAKKTVRDIRSRGKLPIVVGGTHYYADALLFEGNILDTPDTGDVPSHAAASHPVLDGPIEDMIAKLREVDPEMADRWHPNDRRKIRRSLEIYLTTGRRASEIYADQQKRKESRQSSSSGPWQSLLFWVYSKPDVLDQRLSARVDKMLDGGLLSETQQMHDYLQSKLRDGVVIDRSKGIWQSIGFKQMEPYLDGLRQNVSPAELEALKQKGLENMKTATRRYAKDQVRWLKYKTLPHLKDENALDHLFLLDGTDLGQWDRNVAETAA